MRDLKDPRWMYLKALLLLATGSLASVLLLLEHPTLRDGVLLAIAIWAFCRVYYFCFYVIERYIDPEHRFSGLGSAAIWLLRPRNGQVPPEPRHRAT